MHVNFGENVTYTDWTELLLNSMGFIINVYLYN